MTIKERERDKTIGVVPEKKSERPANWHVVMYYEAPHNLPCCACLLTRVFNMSTIKAMEHISQAKRQGKIAVYESIKDVVETKAQEAEGQKRIISTIARGVLI
jgi:hypothetical protein